jgi:hypothetical protein
MVCDHMLGGYDNYQPSRDLAPEIERLCTS